MSNTKGRRQANVNSNNAGSPSLPEQGNTATEHLADEQLSENPIINEELREVQKYLVFATNCKQIDDYVGRSQHLAEAVQLLQKSIEMSQDEQEKEQLTELLDNMRQRMPEEVESRIQKDKELLYEKQVKQILQNHNAEESRQVGQIGSLPEYSLQQNAISEETHENKPEGQPFSSVRSNITFKDVHGLARAKQSLLEATILPRQFPQLFRGRDPWKSILLYGVPGTGKTLLAKALAGELNCCFLSASPSDIMSKFQGDSEKQISNLFNQARQNTPAVIFLDEIDSMMSERSSDETEASKRIKTEFMVQMQGIDSQNKDILVIGATNYPERIDPAIRRRFEKRILIDLPNFEARKAIMLQQLSRVCNNVQEAELLKLKAVSEGYSASDIANVMKQAIMCPIRELQSAEYFRLAGGFYVPCGPGDACAKKMRLLDIPQKQEVKEEPVTLRHIQMAFTTVKKSVSSRDIARIEEFREEFGAE